MLALTELSSYYAGHRGVDAHSATLTNNVLEVHVADFDLDNLPPNVKTIKSRNGQFIIVDSDWYEMLSLVKWYVYQRKIEKGIYVKAGGGEAMHRIIMCPPKGIQVDHINGNTLDNRRCNLRLCSGAQNQWNTRPQKNNTSGYKGVYWGKGKWIARTMVRGKHIHIGSFESILDAAKAYNAKVSEVHGEFAFLNKIEDDKAIEIVRKAGE